MTLVKTNEKNSVRYLAILKDMKKFLEEKSDVKTTFEITDHLRSKGHFGSFAQMFFILGKNGFMRKEGDSYQWNNMKPCTIHTAEQLVIEMREYTRAVKARGNEKNQRAKVESKTNKYWLKAKPEFNSILNGFAKTSIVIVIGGFIGLWQFVVLSMFIAREYSVSYWEISKIGANVEFASISSMPLIIIWIFIAFLHKNNEH
jgi:hypothetical protein